MTQQLPTKTEEFTASLSSTAVMRGGAERWRNWLNTNLVKLLLSSISSISGTIPAISFSGDFPNLSIHLGIPNEDSNSVMELVVSLNIEARRLLPSSPGFDDAVMDDIRDAIADMLPSEIVKFIFEGTNSNPFILVEETGLGVTGHGATIIDISLTRHGVSSLKIVNGGLSVQPSLGISYGDFTIEGWYRFSSSSPDQILCGQWEETGNKLWFIKSSPVNGTTEFYFAPYSDVEPMLIGSSLPINSWVHVEVTRSNNTFALFINGVMVDSVEASVYERYQPIPVSIGGIFSEVGTLGSRYYRNFVGNVDNFRIVRGRAIHTNGFLPSDFVQV